MFVIDNQTSYLQTTNCQTDNQIFYLCCVDNQTGDLCVTDSQTSCMCTSLLIVKPLSVQHLRMFVFTYKTVNVLYVC